MTVCHTTFLHDFPGGVVPGKKGRIHGVNPFFPVQVFEKAFDRLGRIAAVPERRADPIADLTRAVLFVEIQDDPNEAPGTTGRKARTVLHWRSFLRPYG